MIASSDATSFGSASLAVWATALVAIETTSADSSKNFFMIRFTHKTAASFSIGVIRISFRVFRVFRVFRGLICLNEENHETHETHETRILTNHEPVLVPRQLRYAKLKTCPKDRI